MKILEKNGRYFDRPISDHVTEMTRSRKHKCIVEFSWISADHTSVTEDSLLVKGFSSEEHSQALDFLVQKAESERQTKARQSLEYELKHGLIEHPDEQRFLMPETNLDNSSMLKKDDENWTEGSEGSQKLGYDNKYMLKRLEKEKLFKKDWVLAYHARLKASEKIKNLEFHSANIIQMPSYSSLEIEE